jgi:hypothetical protein
LKKGNVMSLQNAGEWSKAILTLQSVPAAIKTCHETHAFENPSLLISKSQKIHQADRRGFGRYCAQILRQHPT